jgi:hypothetical protein
MSQPNQINDLIVLVADKNMEFAIKGILENHHKLKIQPLPEMRRRILGGLQDGGCFRRCDDFLRSFSGLYKYALVMLDREGSGQEDLSRVEIENHIEKRLAATGWGERAKAIVFDPELEIWVWSDSPQVDEVLGWVTHQPDLRNWLIENNWLKAGETKPKRPKEAVEAVLREVKRSKSSSIYFALAQRVSFGRCTDPAFLKLKNQLREWFPQN